MNSSISFFSNYEPMMFSFVNCFLHTVDYLNIALLLAMKYYVQLAFVSFYSRAHSTMWCVSVIFYLSSVQIVNDSDGVLKGIVGIQYHLCNIHPMEMVCHMLNDVNHKRWLFVCIHYMCWFDLTEIERHGDKKLKIYAMPT